MLINFYVVLLGGLKYANLFYVVLLPGNQVK